MSIQPINENQLNFSSKKLVKTSYNNEYYKTDNGLKTGFLAGVGASALLFYTQMKALKTVPGKRNLVASFHEKGLSLNDFMPKSSERSKNIINGFKKNLLLWGFGITAAVTMIGKIIDMNINLTREKRADETSLLIK